MSEIKERPILFSGEMVRAILEGRKTQTRRILKIQPLDILPMNIPNQWVALVSRDPNHGKVLSCRFGQPGDRLWVRESFNWSSDEELSPNENHKYCPERNSYSAKNVVWRADGQEWNPNHSEWGHTLWKPSIHMPRWASRILLEITNIRAERVQDITEQDATFEGVTPSPTYRGSVPGEEHRFAFRDVFMQINDKTGELWQSNPWVWVIEFKVLEIK